MHDKNFLSVQELSTVQTSEENRGHTSLSGISGEPRGNKTSWLGVPTYKDVERIVERGWPEGVDKMQQNVKLLSPIAVQSVRRRRVRRNFGDAVDMQKVYCGELDRAWDTHERIQAKSLGKSCTTIFVGLTANCSRSSNQLFWAGATAVTVAQNLERSGRRVAILGYSWTRDTFLGHPKEENILTVRLKNFQEPLDIDKMAATTALAGFFRVYMFRAMLASPARCTSNLGHPQHIQSGRVKKADLPVQLRSLAGSEATLVIDDIWDRFSAQSFLDKQLEDFGAK